MRALRRPARRVPRRVAGNVPGATSHDGGRVCLDLRPGVRDGQARDDRNAQVGRRERLDDHVVVSEGVTASTISRLANQVIARSSSPGHLGLRASRMAMMSTACGSRADGASSAGGGRGGQAGRRSVEEQHAGPCGQGAGDVQTALLTSGQVPPDAFAAACIPGRLLGVAFLASEQANRSPAQPSQRTAAAPRINYSEKGNDYAPLIESTLVSLDGVIEAPERAGQLRRRGHGVHRGRRVRPGAGGRSSAYSPRTRSRSPGRNAATCSPWPPG
jgi:hypothetical protein